MTRTVRLRALGVLALCYFALHAANYARQGRVHEVLWNCTLSNAVIGLGLLCLARLPVAIGVTWLCMGNLAWLADVLFGGEFFVTSLFTHVGGLVVGVLGVAELGWPKAAWLWATLGMLALQQLSRLVTPPAANVNLAFSIYSGWEKVYPSYRAFWLIMFTEAVFVYYVSGRLFERWLAKKGASAAQNRAAGLR